MVFSLCGCFLLVPGVLLGLAWPLAARLPLAPAEKLVASVVLSLLGVFGLAWAIYVWALPPALFGLIPLGAAIGFAMNARELFAAARDADARELLIGQALVTAWCVGWLATTVSYGGGGWAGDWFEHWERTRFFLEHWPRDRMFLVIYPLPARPPLVNVVTGAFMMLTRADFTHYQLVMTLLGSGVFLPAALLARRFARHADAIAICAVLFMVNPLFVENAAFAWTKLPAAALTLAGLYFFLRAQERGAPLAVALLCAASLAAGLLAHYSAGPYIVLLVIGWLGLGWPRRGERDWQRATALAALAGALVLATWFGWTIAVYGLHETIASNSSVTDGAAYPGSGGMKVLLNLRDTLVPHFLRTVDLTFIAQRSAWGWWRDWFFLCYQVNLFFAFGSVAWLVLGRELWRAARGAARGARVFWGGFIAGAIVLGVAVHGGRDTWGLAHICLQALVLLGLAWLAARWRTLERPWRLVLLAGATIDLALGIVLQFAAQNFTFDRWLGGGLTAPEAYHSYTAISVMNFNAKRYNHLAFLADAVPLPFPVVLVALAAIFALALARVARGRSATP